MYYNNTWLYEWMKTLVNNFVALQKMEHQVFIIFLIIFYYCCFYNHSCSSWHQYEEGIQEYDSDRPTGSGQ